MKKLITIMLISGFVFNSITCSVNKDNGKKGKDRQALGMLGLIINSSTKGSENGQSNGNSERSESNPFIAIATDPSILANAMEESKQDNPFYEIWGSCEFFKDVWMYLFGNLPQSCGSIAGAKSGNALSRDTNTDSFGDWFNKEVGDFWKNTVQPQVEKEIKDIIDAGAKSITNWLNSSEGQKALGGVVKSALDSIKGLLSNPLLSNGLGFFANAILGSAFGQQTDPMVMAKLEEIKAEILKVQEQLRKLFDLFFVMLEKMFSIPISESSNVIKGYEKTISDRVKAGDLDGARTIARIAADSGSCEAAILDIEGFSKENMTTKVANGSIGTITPSTYRLWLRHELKCRSEFLGVKWDCYWEDEMFYFQFPHGKGIGSMSWTDAQTLITTMRTKLDFIRRGYANEPALRKKLINITSKSYAETLRKIRRELISSFKTQITDKRDQYAAMNLTSLWNDSIGMWNLTPEQFKKELNIFIMQQYSFLPFYYSELSSAIIFFDAAAKITE